MKNLVFVLDDDKDILNVISEILTRENTRVKCFINSNDMLADEEIKDVDLFVLDIVLPGEKNGINIAKILTDSHPGIPFLLISGYGNINIDEFNLDNKNIVDFINKPFSYATLRNRSSILLKASEKIQEMRRETVKIEELYTKIFEFNPVTTIYIDEYNMTSEQKKEHPEYNATGGILITVTYHEACKTAWEGCSEECKKAILSLPNFDPAIFERITGLKKGVDY